MRTLAAHAAHDLRVGNLELVPARTRQGDRLLLYGELDISTAPDLLASAQEILLTPSPSLEVDLAALAFIDSTGLGALLQIAALCEQRGVQFVLASPRANARRLLAMARVSDRLVIRDL